MQCNTCWPVLHRLSSTTPWRPPCGAPVKVRSWREEVTMRLKAHVLALLLALAAPAGARDDSHQGHEHDAGAAETPGTVDFPGSSNADAQAKFGPAGPV